MKRVLIVILALALIAATGWGALVLLFTVPVESAFVRAGLATVYALGSLAVLLWLRPPWRAIAVWGIGLFAILAWWNMLQPSNDREWQPDVAKLSSFEVNGDHLTVHNLRNFDYRTETDFTPRYEDRVFDLSKLRGFDLFMSYWGSPAIAHTIISWDFDDSLPLAISIETERGKARSTRPSKASSNNTRLSTLLLTSVTLSGCVPTTVASRSISTGSKSHLGRRERC